MVIFYLHGSGYSHSLLIIDNKYTYLINFLVNYTCIILHSTLVSDITII